MYLSRRLLLAALLAAVALTGCKQPADDLDAFLADYNVLYRDLWQRAEGARWDANVDVGESELRTRRTLERAPDAASDDPVARAGLGTDRERRILALLVLLALLADVFVTRARVRP